MKPPNLLIEIAQAHGRRYVTSGDVSEALRTHPADVVRLHLLRCLGGEAGCEDASLCAFVAAEGRTDE